MTRSFWDHPDFYDCHDNTSVAGPEREPEHYREFVIALPPIDANDHVVDIGAGTGKLSVLLADAYPSVGQITLVEPNERKLERARSRLADRIGERVTAVSGSVGVGAPPATGDATLVILGSVLMPVVLLRGGTRADAGAWTDRALGEVRALLRPGGWVYDLETVAMPWDWDVASAEAARRLTLPELTGALVHAGFDSIECIYRFRDRVVVRARRPS